MCEGARFVFLTPGGGDNAFLLFHQIIARKFRSSWVLKMSLKAIYLKYSDVHDAELIASIHEVMELFGTDIACLNNVCIGTSR